MAAMQRSVWAGTLSTAVGSQLPSLGCCSPHRMTTARDVAELPPDHSGRFVAADNAGLQPAWASAAWHIQGPPLPMVRLPMHARQRPHFPFPAPSQVAS